MHYNNIGKIVATHGIQGELVLKHALGKKTALKGLEIIFLELRKGEFLPYFIIEAKSKNESEIYLKLDGVLTREDAQKLTQKEVWLPEEDFHRYASRSSPISLLGFHIISDGKNIGEILEVIEQPHQVLCRIDLNGREALIPVHADTLLKVDQKKKEVVLDIPDGLLDIYMD